MILIAELNGGLGGPGLEFGGGAGGGVPQAPRVSPLQTASFVDETRRPLFQSSDPESGSVRGAEDGDGDDVEVLRLRWLNATRRQALALLRFTERNNGLSVRYAKPQSSAALDYLVDGLADIDWGQGRSVAQVRIFLRRSDATNL